MHVTRQGHWAAEAKGAESQHVRHELPERVAWRRSGVLDSTAGWLDVFHDRLSPVAKSARAVLETSSARQHATGNRRAPIT
jgi:hypothetical protein